jgi:serine/threonine-protein kinase
MASTPAGVERARQSGNQSQTVRDPAFLSGPPQSRKMLYIAIAATLIVLAVIGIVLLTRPKQTAVISAGESGNASGNANESGTKPIPPPPAGMVIVTGGKFTMGNPNGDEFEKPVREETVKSFYIDQYEVTNKEYYDFVKAENYRWPQDWPAKWKQGNFGPGEADKPATGIRWADAYAYAKSKQKRLPTEIEWEYAARGSDGRLYPWGNEFNPGFANVASPRTGAARVVGFPKDKSPFNVIGMAGNVSEWTDSNEGGDKIIRGANYVDPATFNQIKSPAEYARLTRRLFVGPEYSDNYIGFRCAKSIP